MCEVKEFMLKYFKNILFVSVMLGAITSFGHSPSDIKLRLMLEGAIRAREIIGPEKVDSAVESAVNKAATIVQSIDKTEIIEAVESSNIRENLDMVLDNCITTMEKFDDWSENSIINIVDQSDREKRREFYNALKSFQNPEPEIIKSESFQRFNTPLASDIFNTTAILSDQGTFNWRVYQDDQSLLLEDFTQEPASRQANSYGMQPIHYACKSRSAELLKALLETGSDCNAVNRWGDTPLILLTQNYSCLPLEQMKILIENGADINAVNEFGRTALFYVANSRRRKSQEKILLLNFLLQNGADPDIADLNGDTPLHVVAPDKQAKYDGAIDRLLQAGADPNMRNNDNLTPFMALRKRYYYPLASLAPLFANAGADLNAEDDDGNTAIFYHPMRLYLTEDLSIAGLDYMHQNQAGERVLNVVYNNYWSKIDSAQSSNWSVMKMLVDYYLETDFVFGADLGAFVVCNNLRNPETLKDIQLDVQDKNNWTPLMVAALCNNLKACEYLLQKGAAVNHNAEGGVTAMMIAIGLGHYEIMQLLLDNGAVVKPPINDIIKK